VDGPLVLALLWRTEAFVFAFRFRAISTYKRLQSGKILRGK
jgi:hypothetical protein